MRQATAWNYLLFAGLALGGTAVDLGSKWFAFTYIGVPMPGGPNPKMLVWPGVFSITTSFNSGALWGLGAGWPYANLVFAGLSLAAAAAILVWLFVYGGSADRTLSIALGLIMAGTIGNCYDRLLFGKVRDFLYIELINWPIFNFADSFLVCGAAILMLQAFLAEFPRRAPATQLAASSEPPAEVSGR